MAYTHNLTLYEQIQQINALPLDMIKNSILKSAADELNTKITFANIKNYRKLVIKHTDIFLSSLNTTSVENKPFKLFS